jgi:hypothetical protein
MGMLVLGPVAVAAGVRVLVAHGAQAARRIGLQHIDNSAVSANAR